MRGGPLSSSSPLSFQVWTRPVCARHPRAQSFARARHARYCKLTVQPLRMGASVGQFHASRVRRGRARERSRGETPLSFSPLCTFARRAAPARGLFAGARGQSAPRLCARAHRARAPALAAPAREYGSSRSQRRNRRSLLFFVRSPLQLTAHLWLDFSKSTRLTRSSSGGAYTAKSRSKHWPAIAFGCVEGAEKGVWIKKFSQTKTWQRRCWGGNARGTSVRVCVCVVCVCRVTSAL